METWDTVLMVVAGYWAITTLVRLMNGRRRQMLAQLRQEMEQSKKRKKPDPAQPPQGSARKVA